VYGRARRLVDRNAATCDVSCSGCRKRCNSLCLTLMKRVTRRVKPAEIQVTNDLISCHGSSFSMCCPLHRPIVSCTIQRIDPEHHHMHDLGCCAYNLNLRGDVLEAKTPTNGNGRVINTSNPRAIRESAPDSPSADDRVKSSAASCVVGV
jgi:hypothetical protein